MISPRVPSRKVWTLLVQVVLFAATACGGTLDLPTVEISATTLAFGNQVVESRSQPQKVLLLNRGNAPLSIKKIAASGDFAVESDCGTTLEAGHGCTIVTMFSPSLVGDADGKLTIEDDSKSSPHVVNLSGSGVLPLTMTPATLRFGARTVGTSETSFVTLTNNQPDRIAALQIATAGDFSQSSSCSMGIPAGKSCDVRITFTPREAKQVRGKITFAYGGKTQALMAVGTGVAAAPMVSGLRVAVPRMPAVTALAPIIPPAPSLNGVRAARATAPADAPAIIPPAPAVSGVTMARGKTSVADAQVIPPTPKLNAALPIAIRAAPRPGTSSEVISPPPKTTGSLTPSARVVHASPGVIAPAPSTNSLRQNARVTAADPDVSLRPSPPVEAAKPPAAQLATMNAPADTSAMRAIAEGSASTPASATMPVMKPATDTPKQAAAPAVLAANVAPPRNVPDGPKVRLMVGLKGTAVGAVTSSNGTINCGAACQDSFAAGQKVVLTPQVPANASFAGWRGCDSVAGSTCTVLMDRDKSVTAIFVRHYDDLSPE